MSKNKIRAS